LRYTPTHASLQEPMKSARERHSFRAVLDGFVPRTRTITRTISLRLDNKRCIAVALPATPVLTALRWRPDGADTDSQKEALCCGSFALTIGCSGPASFVRPQTRQ
jgi:hypothetical protein